MPIGFLPCGCGYCPVRLRVVRGFGGSSASVSAHMRRIFTKLGVGSRAAMVAALTNENP
ncbi:hypothetical protein [Amycolatopsis regifaucium]|uniref:hypothetical protein n=1 Tax=Amycolatopsis regifaucium TaxID=546365 RepID=UPI001FC97E72|nr:hypothetical protein [Amycolatopsis regifaucium]